LLTVMPPGKGKLLSVGRAIPGIELRIDSEATAEDGVETAATHGELLARGPSVFDGYLHAPSDTQDEAFAPGGWFRTGDLGTIDEEGYVYLTGRKRTLIVTSAGKNIQPDPLEEAYARHPVVAEIGVLAEANGLAAVVVPDARAVAASGIPVDD